MNNIVRGLYAINKYSVFKIYTLQTSQNFEVICDAVSSLLLYKLLRISDFAFVPSMWLYVDRFTMILSIPCNWCRSGLLPCFNIAIIR